MDWIHNYQLFLFDFDGLLVNTEELHYAAYIRMCQRRGVHLSWSFSRYCMAAHYESTGLRDQVYKEFPKLQAIEPDWNVLYQEKKQAYMELLGEGRIHLMPGVEKLLTALDQAGIKRCVVTHSPQEQIESIRKQNPILDTIPAWYTREHYSQPKPHPECYYKAISELAGETDQIIGFEDTPRGLRALQKTRAQPVLICTTQYPEMLHLLKDGVIHYNSLLSIPINRV
jgi:beta-phosphoglucomutase